MKALKGENNVEALVYAIDARLTAKTSLIVVGRASYELGDAEATKKLRLLMGEEERVDDKTGKLFLTDDLDCCQTAQEIIDVAFQTSYLAEMANCYVHALNEQTLILPMGWQARLQDIPSTLALKNLELRRLDPLDFLICKGAAGRAKDIKFIQAFCQVQSISREQIQQKVTETLTGMTARLHMDPLAQKYLKMLPNRIYTKQAIASNAPCAPQDTQEPKVEPQNGIS